MANPEKVGSNTSGSEDTVAAYFQPGFFYDQAPWNQRPQTAVERAEIRAPWAREPHSPIRLPGDKRQIISGRRG